MSLLCCQYKPLTLCREPSLYLDEEERMSMLLGQKNFAGPEKRSFRLALPPMPEFRLFPHSIRSVE